MKSVWKMLSVYFGQCLKLLCSLSSLGIQPEFGVTIDTPLIRRRIGDNPRICSVSGKKVDQNMARLER